MGGDETRKRLYIPYSSSMPCNLYSMHESCEIRISISISKWATTHEEGWKEIIISKELGNTSDGNKLIGISDLEDIRFLTREELRYLT